MLKVSTHTRAPKGVRPLRIALCLAALFVVSVLTHAQTAQPTPTKPAATSATTNDTKPTAPTNVPPDTNRVASDEATRTRRAATTDESAAAAPVDELDKLREQIKATSDAGERGRLQRELMVRLATAHEKAAALDELRLLLHEDRFDPAFFYNLGNTFVQLGDNSAGVDAYRKAISQRRGHYARALNNLGVILLRQGRWDEAYDALASALTEEHNTYAEASYNLGRLYLLRGDASLAIREWQHTLALQPDHADAAALSGLGVPEGRSHVEGRSPRRSRAGGGGARQHRALQ